jgi:uncharacterized protein YbjT (DUF2867 family)
MSRTILITGVTGNQGGAVAQALQGSGFRLRGLTRKPESERAAALARHGVDVVTFTDAAALNRREIDLAGDVRTMPEAAEILTEALRRPIAFAQTPIEQVRQYSEDTALMLQWFERVGYSADIAGLEREFGRALTKLPDWARRHATKWPLKGDHEQQRNNE